MAGCEHPLVLVDYDHPHGTTAGVSVAELRASDPTRTRAVMALRNARCGRCGEQLGLRSLGPRVRPGGDSHDGRFVWS
jgi:hypothetical protein